MRSTRAVALVACLTLAQAPRRAAAEPDDIVGLAPRPSRGQLWLDATVELNLSRQRGGSRAIAPDVWWGVTDRTTVAIAHSARSVARIDDVGGLCVASCDERPRYAVAALLRHRLLARAGWDLGAQAGWLVRDLSPWKPAVLLGATARRQRGRFAVATSPYLQLGVANTDRGNRARLVAPLYLAVQPTCRWSLGLKTGVDGELAVLRDGYRVPVTAEVTARLHAQLLLTVEAGFGSLLGPQNTGFRSLASVSLQARL
jgi:hypothetical protein